MKLSDNYVSPWHKPVDGMTLAAEHLSKLRGPVSIVNGEEVSLAVHENREFNLVAEKAVIKAMHLFNVWYDHPGNARNSASLEERNQILAVWLLAFGAATMFVNDPDLQRVMAKAFERAASVYVS